MTRTVRPKEFDTAIEEIKKELNLTNEKIHIGWRKTLAWSGYEFKCGEEYYVYIAKDMSFENSLITLAHELRHVYQDVTGMYKQVYIHDEGWRVLWEGNIHKKLNSNNKGYNTLPWELDAENWAVEYVKKYKATHGSTKQEIVEPVLFSNGNINYRQTVLRAHNEKKSPYFKGCDKAKIKRAIAQLKTQGVFLC
jgi:hypothetical protein